MPTSDIAWPKPITVRPVRAEHRRSTRLLDRCISLSRPPASLWESMVAEPIDRLTDEILHHRHGVDEGRPL
jgi:hypothetical protein